MSVPVWVSEVTSTTWGLEGAPLILTELKKKKKKKISIVYSALRLFNSPHLLATMKVFVQYLTRLVPAPWDLKGTLRYQVLMNEDRLLNQSKTCF